MLRACGIAWVWLRPWSSECVCACVRACVCVCVCSGFISPLSPCFISVLVVSLRCFTAEVEDPYADRTYISNLQLHQN